MIYNLKRETINKLKKFKIRIQFWQDWRTIPSVKKKSTIDRNICMSFGKDIEVMDTIINIVRIKTDDEIFGKHHWKSG